MFNIAFPELVVIFVVSLIVIGPDKLPKLAQTLGVMVGRMQRFMSTIKNDIDQEMKKSDLLRLQEELNLHNKGLNEELRKGMQPVADVIRRRETTVSEAEDPASTQLIDAETEQKQPLSNQKESARE
ncbi:Sec-independent protein translocase protein TatB [Methylophaga thalassica]|uniref:Sec-independent protein translocase protein TatB n=1 Tax=Methylophaga thalassica TaxID=40223 RepID=UPI002E7C2F69|nr:Sec-independent protein translocase protein TatB [Methylophaga thalassica]WVI85087.1 Sec-independent protein translocase protein TatB [Methylophaga thalassica]